MELWLNPFETEAIWSMLRRWSKLNLFSSHQQAKDLYNALRLVYAKDKFTPISQMMELITDRLEESHDYYTSQQQHQQHHQNRNRKEICQNRYEILSSDHDSSTEYVGATAYESANTSSSDSRTLVVAGRAAIQNKYYHNTTKKKMKMKPRKLKPLQHYESNQQQPFEVVTQNSTDSNKSDRDTSGIATPGSSKILSDNLFRYPQHRNHLAISSSENFDPYIDSDNPGSKSTSPVSNHHNNTTNNYNNIHHPIIHQYKQIHHPRQDHVISLPYFHTGFT
jgi:hypothetical protein